MLSLIKNYTCFYKNLNFSPSLLKIRDLPCFHQVLMQPKLQVTWNWSEESIFCVTFQ